MDIPMMNEIKENTNAAAEVTQEAIEAAKKADKAVVVAGLPDSFESEGYDREHMRMPEDLRKHILNQGIFLDHLLLEILLLLHEHHVSG